MIDALELAGAFVLGFMVAAVLAALMVKHLIELHREERQIGLIEAESWRSERREILNRIQHPNKMPVATTGQVRVPDPAIRERMREMASVGRVVAGTDNGDMELP
jgi:exosome complex RNA-binding protein Rrp42 (RNase PH superfamily)